MTLMTLVFWALLVFGGIALGRSVSREITARGEGRGDALQLLDERVARGEIDADTTHTTSQRFGPPRTSAASRAIGGDGSTARFRGRPPLRTAE
jgi:hypothetical protein